MKARLVVILCAILLGLFVFGQMGIVMAAGSEKQVPFGSTIVDSALDGVLGEEWDDAERSITRIGSYRADVYMKHDGEYWYIAVTKQGRIRGGTVTLWICFDANGDGQLYSKGDDSLMLPESDGRLLRDIDYAYTRSKKAPKKDTSVGGTNDKIGAGKFSDDTYVFEIKIEMNSGDHGSKGNDMVLEPGDTIVWVFGIACGSIDVESPKFIVTFASCYCTTTKYTDKDGTEKSQFCVGEEVYIEIEVTGNCSTNSKYIHCTVSKETGEQTSDQIHTLTLPEYKGAGTYNVSWSQQSTTTKVGPGKYYAGCWGCCGHGKYPRFDIVTCDDEGSPEERPKEQPEVAVGLERGKAPTCLEPPVFQDGFSNPESGWPLYQTTEGYKLGYNLEAEEYFISVKTPNTQAWSINQSAGTFQDFCLEVDTTQVGGPNANEYGVIFGYQDDDNFFAFTISGDGYYSLTERVNGIDTAIVAPTASPSINTGQSTNRLELVVRGSDIHFYVNTRLLTKVTHSTAQEGYLGLYAASISEGDVRIRFDNLEVRQAQ